MDGFALRLKHFCNKRCCGGLAVRTRNRKNGGGAEVKEDLHLACHGDTLFTRRLKLGQVKVHTGGAEDDVHLQIVKVAFSEP